MTESNKKYYTNFKNKHIDEIKQKTKCDLCGGCYTYFNKSHHEKSNKHQYILLKYEIEQLKKQHLNI